MVRGPIPRLAALALLALLPTACGDDDGPAGPGGDLDEGTFEATVSGDLSLTLTGEAVFASVNLGDGFAAWTLTLSPLSGGQQTSLVLTHYGTRPGEGSHTLTLNEQTGEGYQLALNYWDGDDYAGVLLGTSGTLHVTSSSSNRMRGSMQATLEGSISVDGEPQEVTVTVNATFDAFGASL